MIYLWFGLDATGLQLSPQFHPFFGPMLMTAFTFLGNSLFLTILVSILSDTYSKLAASSSAEIQFRRAVLTFEGVKADALFSYPPPFNVLFLFVLLPLKLLTSPRWFHKLNVSFVRILNAPILLLISLYERRFLWRRTAEHKGQSGISGITRRRSSTWGFLGFWEQFGAHVEMQMVFDQEPPVEVQGRMDEMDGRFADVLWENSNVGGSDGLGRLTGFTKDNNNSSGGGSQEGVKRRRASMGMTRPLANTNINPTGNSSINPDMDKDR